MEPTMFETTPNRREFLQVSLAAATAAALARSVSADTPAASAPAATSPAASPPPAAASPAAPAKARTAADVIELGPSKIKVSRMAVGTGTYGAGGSSNQLRALGAQGVADMLLYAFDHGVFTWDTSDGYGTHAAVKLALKKVPRDKVTIITKTPDYSGANLKPDLDRFLKEMETDYIDILLLHSRVRANWDTLDKPMMDVLTEAQQKKIVRSFGISIHSLDAMKTAAKSPWLEIAMCRCNPTGTRMDGPPDRVIPVMKDLKAAGKGVISIKVLGEGSLTDRLDEVLQFALDKNPADCFSLGCESKEQFKDNFDRIAKLGKVKA
jgi:aryl-alcohol dehydrogenase-like predicted oxidoreductase